MVSAIIWSIAQMSYTLYSTLTHEPRKLLEKSVFQADFPENEVKPTSTLPEKVGGVTVAKAYSVGADLMTDKDFNKRRKEMTFDPRYDLQTIKTGDNILIDTVRIEGKVRKVILIAPGLGDRFESLHIKGSLLSHIYELIKEKLGDVTVMSLNVRGSGLSTGEYTPKWFHIDIYSVYQYLIDMHGFDPENIYIYGESLGGCTGLRAALLVQKKYKEKQISAITDRSFLHFVKVIEERAPEEYRDVALDTVRSIGLDINCEEAAKGLKGRILAIGAHGDLTVPFNSFFGNQPVVQGLANCEVIYMKGNGEYQNPHCREFLPTEREAIGKALQKMTSILTSK